MCSTQHSNQSICLATPNSKNNHIPVGSCSTKTRLWKCSQCFECFPDCRKVWAQSGGCSRESAILDAWRMWESKKKSQKLVDEFQTHSRHDKFVLDIQWEKYQFLSKKYKIRVTVNIFSHFSWKNLWMQDDTLSKNQRKVYVSSLCVSSWIDKFLHEKWEKTPGIPRGLTIIFHN